MTAIGVDHRVGAESARTFPAELTSFVGRRRERAELRRALSEARVVTVTGFGGMGKTRLALRVAADTRRAFRGGTWFVDLSELSAPDLLADTVARALGLRGFAQPAAVRALTDLIGSREALLILDNCEHLVEACASLVSTLVRHCPSLRVLATSREPLQLSGEAIFPVDPLSIPAADQPAGAPIQHYESVRLFLDRAQATAPGFELTPENRSAVIGICRQIEGVPLALELAAVRLRAQSPAEILEHLTDHRKLLTAGTRDAPDRQRTIDACVAWSYELCGDDERDLWQRASVFPGDFETDALRHLYAGDDTGPDRVLDLLHALTTKSVLTSHHHRGRARHRMLEPIREYGHARLVDANRLDEIARRLRDWCSTLAARFAAEWLGPQQVEWIARLRSDQATIAAAIDYCARTPGETEAGLQIATDLHHFAIATGQFGLFRHWLERLLSVAGEPSATRVSAARTATWLAAMQGDLDTAARLLEQHRALSAGLAGIASADIDEAAGVHAIFAGDMAEALTRLRRALTTYRAADETLRMVETIELITVVHGMVGEHDDARASHEEMLAITGPLGEGWFRSLSLWIIGLSALAQGQLDEAADLERESLRLSQALDDRLAMALGLDALAWLAAQTDCRRAALLLGAADALWQTMGTSTLVNPGLAASRTTCEQTARETLGQDRFTAAYEHGLSLGTPAAVDFAVTGTMGTTTDHSRADHADASATNTLTRREQEIAELVAEGMTNREIASHLVIAVRTAETHVAHIMTKLGFTARTQIATWITEQQAH